MRWTPTTGFFQVLVDMKNAANVVPGVFAATGHDYRADLLPFFNAVLGLDATPDQLASIGAWLEARESVQSQWMKAHGAVEKSLAATVLQRLMQEERDAGRDPDERLIQVFRTVAREEFGVTVAASRAPAPPSTRREPTGDRARSLVELAAVGAVALVQRRVPSPRRAAGPARDQHRRRGRARRPGPGRRARRGRARARARRAPAGPAGRSDRGGVPIVAGVGAAVAVPADPGDARRREDHRHRPGRSRVRDARPDPARDRPGRGAHLPRASCSGSRSARGPRSARS